MGTHAPASAWGAIDLGIDGDGDGEAEPDSTRGTFVLATHDGVADVWMNSWPGGNFVRVVNEESGWSTAYAHLDGVAVADGQSLTAGTPLGTVGTTGLSSGPHLHYEVWLRGRNLDPTAIAPCWR